MTMTLWQSIQDQLTLARTILNDYAVAGGMSGEGVDNLRSVLDKLQDVVNANVSGTANNAAVTVPANLGLYRRNPDPDPIIEAFLNAG